MSDYLKNRASEPSTWRGLIMLAGALAGYQIDPNVSESVVTVLVAMAGSGITGIFSKG